MRAQEKGQVGDCDRCLGEILGHAGISYIAHLYERGLSCWIWVLRDCGVSILRDCFFKSLTRQIPKQPDPTVKGELTSEQTALDVPSNPNLFMILNCLGVW